MTGRKTCLDDCKKIDGPKVIFRRNDKPRKTKGIGTIKKKGLEIKEVSYVKGLNFNHLSTSQFCNKGYTMELSRMDCKIKHVDIDKVILIEKRHKNVYLVDWSIGEAEVCLLSKGFEELS